MLAVFARSGFPLSLVQTEGDIHVTLLLTDRLDPKQSERHDDTSPVD